MEDLEWVVLLSGMPGFVFGKPERLQTLRVSDKMHDNVLVCDDYATRTSRSKNPKLMLTEPDSSLSSLGGSTSRRRGLCQWVGGAVRGVRGKLHCPEDRFNKDTKAEGDLDHEHVEQKQARVVSDMFDCSEEFGKTEDRVEVEARARAPFPVSRSQQLHKGGPLRGFPTPVISEFFLW
ncbi:hypothetical protein H6P81_002441 [Aristolochia fimbriata]|uniref:Uncharacterized protein n=1 Tax=Aristolochia fimbriata TaxID=158543 RepID=A0AAV7FAG4_ARIFI|nr:hypothetical protein H6P81_002441 [Aristolochia fimbriata]